MEPLATAVLHGRVLQYMALAGTTVFFYDYTLTLPSEVSWSDLAAQLRSTSGTRFG